MSVLRLGVVESFREDAEATSRLLATHPSLEVVATAVGVGDLPRIIKEHQPDLLLLDLALLRHGTRRLPIAPLVAGGQRLALLSDAVGAATKTAKEEATRAIFEGALGVLHRPPTGKVREAEQLRQAFAAEVERLARAAQPVKKVEEPAPEMERSRVAVVGVLASTGGPSALTKFLKHAFTVPVLVAMHIPAGFARGFARTLRGTTGQSVIIAREGQLAEPGKIYLPPDGLDLGLSPQLRLRVGVRVPGLFHPNGNVLLEDLAHFGGRAIGVVLTGMGDDGLVGARKLRAAGGRLVVQDRESSVVYGMPGAIAGEGLAAAELPPAELSKLVRQWTSD